MCELPNLPLLVERFDRILKERFSSFGLKEAPTKTDYEIIDVFKQVWGSTALGFCGIGGCMLTSAYTTVVYDNCSGVYGVFFGEKFAYAVWQPEKMFFDDLKEHCLVSVVQAGGRY